LHAALTRWFGVSGEERGAARQGGRRSSVRAAKRTA
jgi:hypothetical protein